MNEYDENQVFDWDDEVEDDGSSKEFVTLEPGKYDFEVVGFEREMDSFGERKFHTKIGVDKEKGLFVYHRVRLGLPIAVGTVENEQG